jgi:hypothetical protein
MGIKKGREGCLPCMGEYFALAKQHGATEEELQQAIQKIETKTASPNLARRDVLKLVAAGGLAATTTGLTLGMAKNSYGQAQTVEAWWGTDSSSQSCCDMPQNFYVGRMGYGAEPQGDAYFFNINSAQAAGNRRTFGYWGLVGPSIRGISSPKSWGQQQARCAWNAWNHGPHAPYIGGETIFADVEPGFSGWRNGNYQANQAVLNGFLYELFTITPPHVWPGLYISPLYWTNFFGQNFRPATDFVLWLTGYDTCGRDLCSPCNYSCSTLASVRNRLASSINHIVIGGHMPVVWQYWISNFGCGDFNVMMQNEASLLPIKSNTLYSVH